MNKGYYSMLNKIIRQKKTDDQYIIDRDELKKHINFEGEDPAEIEDMCKNLMIGVMLYQNNYRSVIKGQCVYIDTDALKSKTIAEHLVSNQSLDVKSRTAALQKLEKIASDLPEDDFSQLSFTVEEDGSGILYQEMSREELITLIRELQKEAVNL